MVPPSFSDSQVQITPVRLVLPAREPGTSEQHMAARRDMNARSPSAFLIPSLLLTPTRVFLIALTLGTERQRYVQAGSAD
jgi:hypothetical protein